jgi:hypothetical protein
MVTITELQRARAQQRAMLRNAPDTEIGEDDQNVVVDGIKICHDCIHVDESHSIADPNGDLGYGGGNCGNCTECDHSFKCLCGEVH